jgi:hypothetical protein
VVLLSKGSSSQEGYSEFSLIVWQVLGGCNRCQMVNIDQATGLRHSQSQPLATLASYRRIEVEIFFLTVGVLNFFLGSLAYMFCKKLCIFIYLDTGLQRGLCISIMLNDPDFNCIT